MNRLLIPVIVALAVPATFWPRTTRSPGRRSPTAAGSASPRCAAA